MSRGAGRGRRRSIVSRRAPLMPAATDSARWRPIGSNAPAMMSVGAPDLREPWLERLHAALAGTAQAGGQSVGSVTEPVATESRRTGLRQAVEAGEDRFPLPFVDERRHAVSFQALGPVRSRQRVARPARPRRPAPPRGFRARGGATTPDERRPDARRPARQASTQGRAPVRNRLARGSRRGRQRSAPRSPRRASGGNSRSAVAGQIDRRRPGTAGRRPSRAQPNSTPVP